MSQKLGLNLPTIETIVQLARNNYYDPTDSIVFTWCTADIEAAAPRDITYEEAMKGLAYLEDGYNEHTDEYCLIDIYIKEYIPRETYNLEEEEK